mgnify:FL=1
MKTYLSLGWGVQSFTIAAMVALGDLPPITAAIHADTTHESEHTYKFAEKWTAWLEARGVKVVTVKADNANLVESLASGAKVIHPPVYAKNGNGVGQTRRQCTRHWKVVPMKRYIKPLLARGEQAEQWIGISTDEIQRAKDSDVKYIKHGFPLLDKCMSRADCIQWLETHGLEVPPKSSCTFCPFHNKRAWQEMKRRGGLDWQDAIKADELIRHAQPDGKGISLYIHSSGKPLAQAVTIPEDFGAEQGTFDLDNAACDSGHCFL